MDKHELRRINFRTVLKRYRTHAEFSELSGISRAQISQLTSEKSKYRMGHELARKIEAAASKPDGWLDIDHTAEENDLDDLDLIVRTVSIVNKILDKHDMQVNRMKQDAYENVLRNAIKNSVRLGIVTDAQVQHSLFSAQLQSLAT